MFWIVTFACFGFTLSFIKSRVYKLPHKFCLNSTIRYFIFNSYLPPLIFSITNNPVTTSTALRFALTYFRCTDATGPMLRLTGFTLTSFPL